MRFLHSFVDAAVARRIQNAKERLPSLPSSSTIRPAPGSFNNRQAFSSLKVPSDPGSSRSLPSGFVEPPSIASTRVPNTYGVIESMTQTLVTRLAHYVLAVTSKYASPRRASSARPNVACRQWLSFCRATSLKKHKTTTTTSKNSEDKNCTLSDSRYSDVYSRGTISWGSTCLSVEWKMVNDKNCTASVVFGAKWLERSIY